MDRGQSSGSSSVADSGEGYLMKVPATSHSRRSIGSVTSTAQVRVGSALRSKVGDGLSILRLPETRYALEN